MIGQSGFIWDNFISGIWPEDISGDSAARGGGIGKVLMWHVAGIPKARGCGWLEWSTAYPRQPCLPDIWEKGTNRSRFFRGQVDKYTWVGIGSSYLMSDVLAAFLYAQLELASQIQQSRQRIWEYYDQHLSGWAESHNVCRPVVLSRCQ